MDGHLKLGGQGVDPYPARRVVSERNRDDHYPITQSPGVHAQDSLPVPGADQQVLGRDRSAQIAGEGLRGGRRERAAHAPG